MKANLKFWTVLLCAGIVLGGCSDDPIAPEVPNTGDDNPPVEQPDEPVDKPLTDGSLFTVQLNDDIMATVGTNSWNAITYGNGKYVAVGSGFSIAYSTDGTSWTISKGGTHSSSIYSGMAYGNGKFVACGSSGNISYSTDGTRWTDINKGRTGWSCVAYGNNRFVIVGTTSVALYSTDGITWNEVEYPANGANHITYGNGKFVAAGSGYGAKVCYSTNGTSWTEVNSLSGGYFSGIAYGNNKFVLLQSFSSSNNGAYYSTDGITWTRVTVDFKANMLAYGNGKFVAVGNSGLVAYSTDGINWETVDSGTTENLDCVCIMQ